MKGATNKKDIENLLAGCSREDLVYLNGYISGLLNQQTTPTGTENAKPSSKKLTIAYGTESGNSKKLASDFAAKAKKHGIAARLVGLDQYRLNDLPKEEYFITIVSTQGEGDPPDAARKFYDHIHNNGFQLERLKYSVLALGDTAYPLFCKAGEDVDTQLHKLGGQRMIPLQKCDTDFYADADMWFSQVLNQFDSAPSSASAIMVPAKKAAGKKNFTGTILSAVNLNDRGSQKETYHIEIGTGDIDYLPGDSMGVVPKNTTNHIIQVLQLAGIDKDQPCQYRNKEYTAFEVLQNKLNIEHLPVRVLKKYAGIIGMDIPENRMDLQTLLRNYPVKGQEQFNELLRILEPITPRLYSIASSPLAHEGEVHITVARNQFIKEEEIKFGLCSDYLSQLVVGASLEFYIHPNNLFRLPDPEKDIIMIGPGTGIAPFRSFLFQRDVSGATGRNWLFFGEQHFITDFLYQSEIQQWNDSGVLTHIDLAFSRDQEKKIYVQHKIRKRGDEFYRWLENGAIVYVCGTKDPMSWDVEQTIIDVVKTHGHTTDQEAHAYFNEMKETGRFLADVY